MCKQRDVQVYKDRNNPVIETSMMLPSIRVAIHYMKEEIEKTVIKALLCFNLEYATVI